MQFAEVEFVDVESNEAVEEVHTVGVVERYGGVHVDLSVDEVGVDAWLEPVEEFVGGDTGRAGTPSGLGGAGGGCNGVGAHGGGWEDEGWFLKSGFFLTEGNGGNGDEDFVFLKPLMDAN